MRDDLTTMLSLSVQTDTDPHAADPQWRLARWSAEFLDTQTETRYRQHAKHFMARQLVVSLCTWLALMTVFVVPDFVSMGWSARFGGMLAMRVVVGLCVLALLRAVLRDPMVATRGLGATGLLGAGLAGYLAVFLLRPEIAIWTYALTPLILIMLFVFMPNRLLYALSVAVAAAVMVGYSHGWQPHEQLILLLVLTLPIFTGYITARRMQILQRRQYAQIMATRRANAMLQQEAAQRAALEETLRIQASVDPLTGLNNRREYEKLFQHEMARARRERTPLSLAMVDLDHFKRINDEHGHAAGDAVLKATAQLLREQLRSVDIAGRLGGEEFTVLMPNTSLHACAAVMQRMLQALQTLRIPFGECSLQLTATVGVAQWHGGEENPTL
jgi:diguanylate cyclase (GGDEF)-like protein